MRERASEPSGLLTTAVPTLTTTRLAFKRGWRSGGTREGEEEMRRAVDAREKIDLTTDDIAALVKILSRKWGNPLRNLLSLCSLSSSGTCTRHRSADSCARVNKSC